MENYFNYFTEVEERFQRRRGTALLLSTLDWALIETWKEAGIPLDAVLRGIDEAFDRYDARPSKTRKVNSLAYCAQEVLAAAEDMQEAAVGRQREQPEAAGFSGDEVAVYLENRGQQITAADKQLPEAARAVAENSVATLRELANGLSGVGKHAPLEELERRLTVMEEKLFAVLLGATPDEMLLRIRTEADKELAPYKSKMSAAQLEQLMRQYTHKRLLELYHLPRLSLFYMS
ncbi:MAG: hypothetical protein HYX28_05525 [Candidatus Koribacter versatilis]|uniref:Uncharacterized protein n=1 Tax=Candidatus Korobacter versatilis TaxID=658062 RepID=A0A932EQV2_9BACT|nr:hypothetical protein [Candidatus Koribacter versatilis]